MSRQYLRAAAAAGLLSAIGCAPIYEDVEFTVLTDPPVAVELTGSLISIPVGIALQAEVLALDDGSRNQEYTADTFVRLRSNDRSILTVDRGESEDGDKNKYVFVGVDEGETCVDVNIGGDAKECIDVEVRYQAP